MTSKTTIGMVVGIIVIAVVAAVLITLTLKPIKAQTTSTTQATLSASTTTTNSGGSGHVPELYKEDSALGVFFNFLDGIAIESPSDVLPYLSPSFTAYISGVPFPGTYDYETFNSTWLSDFFSTYETVYFYTTALPTVMKVGNDTFQVSAVVQYFVAPTNDPVYLQVFNASVTATIRIVNETPLITQLTWVGNELPPSAVIAGYPSQHTLEANVVLEEFLSQINGMGAEFPPSVIAQYFAPTATLTVEGRLPPGLMGGTYQGINSIEGFFNTWDSYFIFVADYVQNLLANGTAIPPVVSITLNPSEGVATVTANDTVFLGWVAPGQKGYPALYDMHVSIAAYFMYNPSTSMWQITNETMDFTLVPLESDTMSEVGFGAPYYGNTPAFVVVGGETVTVNAASGQSYTLQVGNIKVVVPPGTYAEFTNGTMLSTYNFSLVLMADYDIPPPPSPSGYVPIYTFAFEVNGQITPTITFVNSNGKPQGILTYVYTAPGVNWTSWTWLGGTFNGTVYIGGHYAFPDPWTYFGNGTMFIKFIKPVPWVFEAPQQMPVYTMTSSMMQSTSMSASMSSSSSSSTGSYGYGSSSSSSSSSGSSSGGSSSGSSTPMWG